MHKNLVSATTDEKFKQIVESSEYIVEIARKIGFKHSPGKGSKDRIKQRMKELNLSLKPVVKKERIVKESNYANTKEIGIIGEKAFEFECVKNQITYFKTDNDNLPYDYLLETNKGFKKVQVKTSEFTENSEVIHFSINHGNYYTNSTRGYTPGEIDLVYLYCIETNQSFLIEYTEEKKNISIRLVESRQTKFVNFANDHLFINVFNQNYRD